MTGPILGVDPGVTTGIALRTPGGAWHLIQATPEIVLPVLDGLALSYGTPSLVAVEAFVTGFKTRATRNAGEITRTVLHAVGQWCDHQDRVRMILRPAAAVKPWATDKRLEAAGVPMLRGMPHAADGARHCLYTAVKEGGIPDPLSRNPAPRGES